MDKFNYLFVGCNVLTEHEEVIDCGLFSHYNVNLFVGIHQIQYLCDFTKFTIEASKFLKKNVIYFLYRYFYNKRTEQYHKNTLLVNGFFNYEISSEHQSAESFFSDNKNKFKLEV